MQDVVRRRITVDQVFTLLDKVAFLNTDVLTFLDKVLFVLGISVRRLDRDTAFVFVVPTKADVTVELGDNRVIFRTCLLYTSPSPRDRG